MGLESRYCTRQEWCPGARLRAQVECMAWGCLCLCTCETPCESSSGRSFICARQAGSAVRWAQRWATIACQACTAAFSARLVGPWGREGRYCRDSARLSVHVLA
eukprot:scaffold39577_cov48-Phaeocystis_antarctica.AAC.1